MPRPLTDARWVQDWRRFVDPERRFVDLAVRFRPVFRGAAGGRVYGPLTRPVGYRWDKIAGRQDGPARTAITRDVRGDALELVIPRAGVDTDALFGGRQASKSYGAADRVLLELLLHPGQLGIVASPDYRRGKAIFRRVVSRIPAEWLAERPHVSPPASIRLWNGAEALFLSLHHVDSARSDTIAWAVIDEFGLCQPEAVHNVLLSGVVEGRDMRTFYTATPNRAAWLRRWFEEHSADPQSRVRHLSTRGNPWAKDADYDRLSKGLGPRLQAQELDGLFPPETDRCYPDFREAVHVVDRLPEGPDATREFLRREWGADVARHCSHVAGHDWGKRCQATALGRIWRGPQGRWELYIEREVLSYGATVERHAGKLLDLVGPSLLVVTDASDPEKVKGRRVFEDAGFMVEQCGRKNPLQRERIEAVNNLLDEVPGTARPVLRLLRNVATAGRIEPATEHLRNGLLGLMWADTSDRPVQDKQTPGTDLTHAPDALGYLVWRHWAPEVFGLGKAKERNKAA